MIRIRQDVEANMKCEEFHQSIEIKFLQRRIQHLRSGTDLRLNIDIVQQLQFCNTRVD